MFDEKNSYQELVNCHLTLQDQLFRQTAAMFKYCNNAGIAVSDSQFNEFSKIFQQWIKRRENQNYGPAVSSSNEEKAKQDALPPADQQENNRSNIDLAQIIVIHNDLAGKVGPATPGAILLIESELKKASRWRFYFGLRFLGPVRIVRAMMGVSIIMLLLFLGISLFQEINLDNLALGLYDLHGKVLAYNLLFLLASAGIGASFAALFELRSYITSRTYDTVYATDYWIRFILGLVSGLILAELVPVQDMIESKSYIGDMAKPVLAMLGGFSVQAVYRILQRIVQTLETLVQGREVQDETEVKNKVKTEAKKQNLKTRTDFLSQLAQIQKVISRGDDTDKIKAAVDEVFAKASSFSGI
jgi:hypothetical protein